MVMFPVTGDGVAAGAGAVWASAMAGAANALMKAKLSNDLRMAGFSLGKKTNALS
jgi:hypothetical protein